MAAIFVALIAAAAAFAISKRDKKEFSSEFSELLITKDAPAVEETA